MDWVHGSFAAHIFLSLGCPWGQGISFGSGGGTKGDPTTNPWVGLIGCDGSKVQCHGKPCILCNKNWELELFFWFLIYMSCFFFCGF